MGVIADLAAPAILYVQTIGRIGDIINGEHCSRATDLLFGFQWVHSGTAARNCADGFANAVHPAIAYEMIWNILALAVLWQLRGRLKPDGMIWTLYLALYAIGRFGVTFFREDRIWTAGLQEAQIIALLILAITVPILLAKARFGERVEEAPLVVERAPGRNAAGAVARTGAPTPSASRPAPAAPSGRPRPTRSGRRVDGVDDVTGGYGPVGLVEGDGLPHAAAVDQPHLEVGLRAPDGATLRYAHTPGHENGGRIALPKGASDSMKSRSAGSTMSGAASQSISIEGTALATESCLEAMSPISAFRSSSAWVGTVNPAAAGCPP